MLAIGLVGLTGLFNFARDIGQPFGGFLVGRNFGDPRWFVDNVTPPHWPGLVATGIARDSVLLAIDGRPYDFNDRTVYAEAWAQGRRAIDITYAANGQVVTTRLTIETFTGHQYLDSTLPEVILAASFWMLAIALYRSRPDDRVNRHAAIFFVTLGAYRLTAWPALFRDGDDVARLLEFAFVGMLWPLFAAQWAHFALIFPKTSRWLNRWTLILIYGNTVALSLSYAVVRYLLWSRGWTALIGQWDDILWRWLVFTFMSAVLLLIVRLLIIAVWPATYFRIRRQALVFMAGMLVAMIPIGIWLGSAFGPSTTGFFIRQLDVRYLFLAGPLALASAILRYRAFRSTHPLLKLVVALASSALLASIGAWVWWELQTDAVQAAIAPPFLAFLVILLIVIGAWGVQSVLGSVLARTFNRDSVRIDQSRRFGQALATLPASIGAPALLAETLTQVLRVERAAVWRMRPGTPLTLISLAGDWRMPPPGSLSPALAEALRPVHLKAPDVELAAEFQGLAAAGLELVIPLRGADEPLGLMALGPRPDEEVFDDRDVDALQLIAQQTALFLLSAQQIEEIQRMSQALDQAQEVERLRIAHELHDTTQQSLNGLAFSLTLIRRRLRQDPGQIENLIGQSIAETQQAIKTLYQIRYNLDMSELDRGLIEPVRNMLDLLGQRWGWKVRYSAVEAIDRQLTGPGRAALFRLIHQSLENIAAHARATSVAVTLDSTPERVCFEVTDDGIGSTPDERNRAAENGHLGLRTMRTRVESLGGEFRFDSAPGAGTRVSGWVPLATTPSSD